MMYILNGRRSFDECACNGIVSIKVVRERDIRTGPVGV